MYLPHKPCKGTEEKFTMNLIKLLRIMPRKITGNIIYPLGPKVFKEIIHMMIMGIEIINVG